MRQHILASPPTTYPSATSSSSVFSSVSDFHRSQSTNKLTDRLAGLPADISCKQPRLEGSLLVTCTYPLCLPSSFNLVSGAESLVPAVDLHATVVSALNHEISASCFTSDTEDPDAWSVVAETSGQQTDSAVGLFAATTSQQTDFEVLVAHWSPLSSLVTDSKCLNVKTTSLLTAPVAQVPEQICRQPSYEIAPVSYSPDAELGVIELFELLVYVTRPLDTSLPSCSFHMQESRFALQTTCIVRQLPLLCPTQQSSAYFPLIQNESATFDTVLLHQPFLPVTTPMILDLTNSLVASQGNVCQSFLSLTASPPLIISEQSTSILVNGLDTIDKDLSQNNIINEVKSFDPASLRDEGIIAPDISSCLSQPEVSYCKRLHMFLSQMSFP
ncbi:unnamed protein product [Protopolystoma xenopodis]|uniref:Uncharacterized protein n=1 Tax=Protopolystoma xenopodis TaxID=117903 RepID=A0A448WQ61_9PLAT|nr:unnamed protein product [Protopolystoma xenopodis]